MRVISSLADIEFAIGRIGRSGPDLVIESSPDSTIATKVTVTPRDALRSIAALVTSPSTWSFLLALPFASRRNPVPRHDGWEERRRRVGLNKPW